MNLSRAAVLLVLGVVLAGCQSPESTISTIRKQLSEFKAAPDDVKQLEIEKSFAKLETQIAEVERRGKSQEAEALRRQVATLQSDFQSARVARALNDAKNAIQGIGNAFKEAGQSLSETFETLKSETNAP